MCLLSKAIAGVWHSRNKREYTGLQKEFILFFRLVFMFINMDLNALIFIGLLLFASASMQQ